MEDTIVNVKPNASMINAFDPGKNYVAPSTVGGARIGSALEKQDQILADSKEELLKALDSDFATNINRVYINSLKKEVGFKEITVQMQKNLSRLLIANEDNKGALYEAQCAMIQASALQDSFDVYEITEFDRIKIMLALYQANVFADEVKFTCPVCGTQNSYKVGFDNTLRKLDEFDVEPKDFEYENKNFKYTFTIAYPLVKTLLLFYKTRKVQSGAKNKLSTIDSAIDNTEMMTLFVRKMEITNKQSGAKRTIDFSKFAANDIPEIFSRFSQDVIYSDHGLINIVTTKFLNSINNSFEKHTCGKCGHVYEQENSNQVESFL